MAKVVFEEKQRMRQWWIWLLIGGATAFVSYALLYQLITGEGLGTEPIGLGEMISIEVLMLLLLLFIGRLELQVRIDAAGIHYRFWPFFKWRHRIWAEMQSVEVRQYKPLLDYGGWGFRLGIGGNGWAYNIAGNKGIQLVLQNGDRLLLGTQRPEEAAAAIARLKSARND